jgi:hypothetical protein
LDKKNSDSRPVRIKGIRTSCNGRCGGGVRGPWGNGSHLGSQGESGDPAHQEGERTDSWHRTVEEDTHYKMPQKLGDRLATTPSHVYAQSMYHCVLCINYRTNNHNRNHVFIVLFISGE